MLLRDSDVFSMAVTGGALLDYRIVSSPAAEHESWALEEKPLLVDAVRPHYGPPWRWGNGYPSWDSWMSGPLEGVPARSWRGGHRAWAGTWKRYARCGPLSLEGPALEVFTSLRSGSWRRTSGDIA